MFTTIISFLGILSVLIIVHELGHFFAAKLCGVKVLEFGIGLPIFPKLEIYRKKIGETDFIINGFIFGGYVQLHGETRSGEKPHNFENEEKNKEVKNDQTSLENKNRLQRAFILSAGVLMNFLLGWIILVLMYTIGSTPSAYIADKLKINSQLIISQVMPGSQAEKSGLKNEDVILQIDDKIIYNYKDFSEYLVAGNREIKVQRNNEIEIINIDKKQDEPIGIGIGVKSDEIKLPFLKAINFGTAEFFEIIKQNLVGLGSLGKSLAKAKVPDSVSGPIGIFKITGEVVQNQGLEGFFRLMLVLSISLGVLNILPLPALDGGHLLVIIIEVLIGRKKIPASLEAKIHQAGFIFLIGLMIIITIKDIIKLS